MSLPDDDERGRGREGGMVCLAASRVDCNEERINQRKRERRERLIHTSLTISALSSTKLSCINGVSFEATAMRRTSNWDREEKRVTKIVRDWTKV